MRRLLKTTALLIALLTGSALLIHFTGNTIKVVGWLLQPRHGWDLARKVPAPDYTLPDSWAARPGKESFASFSPQGIKTDPGMHSVDVFFIHPTGYLNRGEWNSPLNPHSRTEENTQWMMANQASVFSSCCNIYAPRYREASIFRYFAAGPEIIEKSMDFAYADVERAFHHFLEHDNQGRPFIIASHSQGTDHAFRLLKNQIDGKPVASRMVAAYLIGRAITNASAASLKGVGICNKPTQTACLIHWATYGEGGKIDFALDDDLVCVNPLTWKRDGEAAAASLHKGGVPPSGKFSIKLWGDDSPQGMVFDPLKSPMAQHTGARCDKGMLIVGDQSGTAFDGLGGGRTANYHGLDYPLFHMDIRENAAARIGAFMQSTDQHAGDTGR